MRLLFLFGIAVLLASSASAQILSKRPGRRPAATPSTTTPDVHWRYSPSGGASVGLTGRTGARVKSADHHTGLNSDGGLIYAIETGERNDKPCYLKVFYSWHNAEYNSAQEFNICGSSGPTSRSLRRIGADKPAATTRVPALLSLQMCSNNRNGDNYRLKGLRAGMAVSIESGQGRVQRASGGTELFERTNCRSWEQQRKCPAGQVIVGMDVQYRLNSGLGPGWITGLAPYCAAPTPIAR